MATVVARFIRGTAETFTWIKGVEKAFTGDHDESPGQCLLQTAAARGTGHRRVARVFLRKPDNPRRGTRSRFHKACR